MPRGKQVKYNQEHARIVQSLAQYGIPHTQIAAHIGVSKNTLLALYSKEIEEGAVTTNNKIAKRLFEKAMDGDTTALIFWCKTRMGWRETQKVDLTSSDGSMSPSTAFDFSLLSPEQIAALRGKLDARNKERQSDTAVTD